MSVSARRRLLGCVISLYLSSLAGHLKVFQAWLCVKRVFQYPILSIADYIATKMLAVTLDDYCKNVFKMSTSNNSVTKNLQCEVAKLQEIAPLKDVFKMSTFGDSVKKTPENEVNELQQNSPRGNSLDISTSDDNIVSEKHSNSVIVKRQSSRKKKRTTDSVYKRETPSYTDLDGYMFELGNQCVGESEIPKTFVLHKQNDFNKLKYCETDKTECFNNEVLTDLPLSLGRRREQFLLDVLLYVCSTDFKLDEYQTRRIRYILSFETTSDFTVHIGNYVRFVLNKKLAIEKLIISTMPSEKTDLDMKEIPRLIRNYGQNISFGNPCEVVLFLVYVCKLCYSFTKDRMLEEYLPVAIVSAEFVIKNSSDDFVDYEKLSNYCGEKILTNCLETEKWEKVIYKNLQNVIKDLIEDLPL